MDYDQVAELFGAVNHHHPRRKWFRKARPVQPVAPIARDKNGDAIPLHLLPEKD